MMTSASLWCNNDHYVLLTSRVIVATSFKFNKPASYIQHINWKCINLQISTCYSHDHALINGLRPYSNGLRQDDTLTFSSCINFPALILPLHITIVHGQLVSITLASPNSPHVCQKLK